MSKNYLLKTASGQYRFRIRIPTYLTESLGKQEIRESLGTDSPEIAQLQAYIRAAEYKLAFNHMKKKKRESAPKRTTVSTGLITFLDGRNNPITIDFGEDAERELEAATQLLALTSSSSPHRPTREERLPLTTAVRQYLEEKKTRGLEERSILDYETMLRDFIELHGDTSLEDVTRESVTQAYTKFKRLPPNRKKLPEFRGKTLSEILAMPIDKPMSKTTSRKFITRISQFFNWCVNWEKMKRNPAAGLAEKKGDGSNDRHPFDDNDIRKLLLTPEFCNRSFKHQYQYWVPLIALFTGARINEICQLRIQDFVIEDGIRCIHFTAEAGNLKTQASKRLVPIHDHLVARGLLGFIEQAKNVSSEKLFPELAEGREGPGQTASRWFSRYKKHCGIEDPKKTFHSFRHTVATRLSYQGCQDYEIADVLGHKTSMITTSRYRDRMLPGHLHATIHKLKFPFIPLEPK